MKVAEPPDPLATSRTSEPASIPSKREEVLVLVSREPGELLDLLAERLSADGGVQLVGRSLVRAVVVTGLLFVGRGHGRRH